MQWPRAIIHVDMDTFFVSVERLNDPSLEGRPVIVGGGRDGDPRRAVVAACSYETRRFGVHSAMPMTRALALCPDAVVIPVGRSDYGAATARVRGVLDSFTDRYEMTSPDEAYVDLIGSERLHGPPVEAAHRLRMMIRTETGLPVSIGLATSRTVAKIASKLSKPRGMFVVAPGGEAAILRPLPLRALPGLGPKTTSALESRGIRTLGQLASADPGLLGRVAGDHAESLRRRAAGECTSPVEPTRERKQISTERTFAEDVGGRAEIESLLMKMSMKVAAQLRRRGEWASTCAVKVRYPDFRTLTRQAPLDPPSHDDQALFRAARDLFVRAWDGRTPLRLLGVAASGLVRATQGDFISDGPDENRERLLAAMDRIRAKEGGAITWGSAMKPPPHSGGDTGAPPRRRRAGS